MTTQPKNIDKAEQRVSREELNESELEKVAGGGTKTTKRSDSSSPEISGISVIKVFDVSSP
jgi:hypothetical protein